MAEIGIQNLNFNTMFLWHEELINAITIVNNMMLEIKKPEKVNLPLSKFHIYDRETFMHSANVSLLTILIARKIGYQGNHLGEIARGAFLHDIGKLKVPKHILNKPGRLTENEYERIKKHPELGMKLVKPFCLPEATLKPIIQHHERWNGTGYPLGLKEGEIHPNAQIVAVADVFAALIADRSYRQALGIKRAIEIIIEGKGKDFSPIIVDGLLKVVNLIVN